MSNQKPNVSVVIPVYNSQQILPLLVERLQSVLSSCATIYELILVDDSSVDGSWLVIDSLASEHQWVRGIHLMRNYGQHNALLCGLRAARYEITVTMDDDLQNPPEEIPNLLEELNKGYDAVYGTPNAEQHGIWRNFASRVLKMGLRISMKSPIAGKVSAFRVLRTHLRNAFQNYRSPFVSLDVLLTWGTTRFSAVNVRHESRQIGVSNYTVSRLFGHAINMITGFSVLPLRFASVIGFFMTLFGVLVLIYVIGRYIMMGGSIPGFPFVASIIAIFSGTQMFALGVIGEYLARVHSRTMERPSYMIGTTTDLPEVAASISDPHL